MFAQRLFAVSRIAATFAGTIIGAGFASGQEIGQFFVSYGQAGLMGILVAAGLFGWLGWALLELGYQRRATAYYEAIYYLCGRRVGLLLDIATAAFLFSALAIVFAGAATVLRDYFAIPAIIGLAAFGLAVGLTVLSGVRGIAAANMIVTPLLIFSVILISTQSLVYHDFDTTMLVIQPEVITPPAPHWLLASLLYVSYNLMVSSTMLVPLGKSVTSRRTRLLGGMAGGLVLGLLAMFVAVVIMIHCPEIRQHEVPILHIAGKQDFWNNLFYALTLLAAIYTSATAGLYGCMAKMRASFGFKPVINCLAIVLTAMICSQAGFSNLIKLLFPVFGYATLWFTVRLAWFSCRDSR